MWQGHLKAQSIGAQPTAHSRGRVTKGTCGGNNSTVKCVQGKHNKCRVSEKLHSVKRSVSRSVMSNSLQPHGLQPARLLCPRDSPGKNTRVGCHAFLQGIFPTQGSNPGLLHCRWILYRLSHQGSPIYQHTHTQTCAQTDMHAHAHKHMCIYMYT